tara:strand:- start:1514 stop:2590 length:1077 start_codon:yes stop_codon:yes gene_type:complete
MGGSWQTPFYFNGIDFGESIKLTNCFIADNHRRVADNELGKVNFNTGEFIIYGSSFNNMRVVINGDAVVKMNCPHFENPQSTAKNKRFLEVIGSHAYCVLDKPQIVIRDTPIYSTLFYCKAGSSQNKHPYAGGLVFISPSYNAAPNYRPDLAAYQDDGIEYESDGYLELVGGGGRVYLEGGAHINSLFYTNSPIPIARNLVGRSTTNINFDNVLGKSAGSWVYVSSEQSVGSHFVEMNRYEGISIVNKANIDQELQQKRVCFQSTMLLGSIRYKIEDIKELNPQGVLETVITFSNINGKKLKDNFVKKLLITTEESIEGDFNFVEKIPIDAYSMNVILRNYGDTQYTVTWNKAILNIV